MHYHEFRAMNTDILLAAEGPTEEISFVFLQVQSFIEASERRFTRFSENSELSALNRSAGSWFDASAEMYELISLALRFHEKTRFQGETRSLFDPSILKALERAGYDRSMEQVKMGESKPYDQLTEAPGGPETAAQFSDIRLNPALRQIYLPAGLRIDLGGIAKGWIAEQAARLLAATAPACAVDAGGDVYFHGLPAGETAWRITLEDPFDETRGVAVLKVGPGAVATSTITRRKWQQGGATMHHLIDPRTQEPSESDLASVTVVAQHTAEAEIYAKCLLIGGSPVAELITESAPGIAFIAVDKNKKLWGSLNSRELLDV